MNTTNLTAVEDFLSTTELMTEEFITGSTQELLLSTSQQVASEGSGLFGGKAVLYSAYLLIAISCIGIPANILTLAVSFRKAVRDLPISPFLISLAVADIIVLASTFPYSIPILTFSEGGSSINLWQCGLGLMAIHWSITASNCITTAISIERFIAVRFPFKAKTLITKKRINILILLIFIIALGEAAPSFNIATIDWGYCSQKNTDDSLMIYNLFHLFVAIAMPMAMCTVFSTLTIISMRRADRKRRKMSSADRITQNIVNQMARMMISICIMFVALKLPARAALVFFGPSIQSEEDLKEFAVVYISTIPFSMLSHCINIVFYVLLGKTFREELKNLLACKASRN